LNTVLVGQINTVGGSTKKMTQIPLFGFGANFKDSLKGAKNELRSRNKE
jgi:hypothetical protein